MPPQSDGRSSVWLLLGLLAAAPAIRGGHEDWIALSITGVLTIFFTVQTISHILRGRSAQLYWRKEDLVVLLLLGWLLVSLKRPLAPPDAFNAWLQILTFVLLFFTARSAGTAPESFRKLITGMIICSSGYVLVAVLQVMNFLPHSWWSPRHYPAATFINHNHFAAYLESLFPIALLLTWHNFIKPRWLAWSGCGILAAGVVLTFSRGSWLSLFLAFTAGLILSRIFQSRKLAAAAKTRDLSWKKTIFAMAGILAVFALLFSRPALNRAATLLDLHFDTSSMMRLSVWQGTLALLRENPITGNGLQSFIFGFPYHRPPGLFRLVDYAHNEYLQLMAEAGLIALVLLLIFFGFLIVRLIRIANQSTSLWKQYAAQGGIISILAFGLHGITDFAWHIPAAAFQFAVVAGLADSLSSRQDQSPLLPLKLSWRTTYPLKRWIYTGLVFSASISCLLILANLITADFAAFRGRRFHQAGNYPAAVKFLTQAARQAPHRVQYHRFLGETFKRQADRQGGTARLTTLENSAAAYRRAVTLTPYDTRSAHGLGMTAKQLGHYPEAEKWLYQAVLRDPNNPLYWKNWGEFQQLNGDALKASHAFRQAVKLAQPYSFFPEAFKGLTNARTYTEKGDQARLNQQWDYAHTSYEIARDFDPGNADALTGLAVIEMQRGNFAQAEKFAEKLKKPEARAKWFAELAYYHLQRNERALSKAAFKASQELDPSNLLALQMRLLFTRKFEDAAAQASALKRLLKANEISGVIKKDPAADNKLIWEPELGQYEYGQKLYQGWGLWGKGSLHQKIYLPPGKIRFEILASGTKANGKGPDLLLSWNRQPVLNVEIDKTSWEIYTAETIVRPGESHIKLSFTNDYRNPLSGEDRNLKIDKVIFSWDPES